MVSEEDIIGSIRCQLPLLRKRFGVRRVGLFGSYSRGQQDDESDIDLIVEFEEPVGLRFVELIEYMESVLKRKVDVLTPEGLRNIRREATRQSIQEEVVYV